MAPETKSLIGTRIAHYRVVDFLGKGGMGEVYVGYDEKLDRRVALKVLRADLHPDQDSRTRFLREARVLSQLDHSNICQIFDYVDGESSDLLVLELISGRALSVSTMGGLPHKQKLAIAEQLCGALVAAHAKGIIHRDLKPENVMLTPEGQVKVLDFGLSRLTRDESTIVQARVEDLLPLASPVPDLDTDLTLPSPVRPTESGPRPTPRVSTDGVTVLGTVMGTIAYMSPEQARGEVATAASDLFSLGLLLQELFTGRPAYERGLPADKLLMKAAAGDTEPVDGLDPDLTALIRRLKSLEPAVRPSAVDTAERLAWIRTKPARTRSRLLLGATIAVLVLFAAAMAIQTTRARKAERAAVREAQTSERVMRILFEIFESPNPTRNRGNTVTVRELLDRATDRIQRELADEPSVQSTLMSAMGRTYTGLGLYQEALPLLEKSQAALETAVGPDDPLVAAGLSSLGFVYIQLGRLDDAEGVLRRSVVIAEEAVRRDGDPAKPGTAEAQLASSLGTLATLMNKKGRYKDARALNERSLAIARRIGTSENVASHLLRLGLTLRKLNERDEAEALYEEALLLAEPADDSSPTAVLALGYLAGAYLEREKYVDAEALYLRALAKQERMFGPDHVDVAYTLANLALLYQAVGIDEKVETLGRRALQLWEKSYGPESRNAAWAHGLLAEFYSTQGRFRDAEASSLRALRILERSVDPDDPEVAAELLTLAHTIYQTGRYAEAENLARKSLRIQEKVHGPNSEPTRASRALLALLLARQGGRDEAREILKRLAAEEESTKDPVPTHLALAQYDLAAVEAISGDASESLRYLRRAFEVLEPPVVWRRFMDEMGRDTDFSTLRSESGFRALLEEGRRRRATQVASFRAASAGSASPAASSAAVSTGRQTVVRVWKVGSLHEGVMPSPGLSPTVDSLAGNVGISLAVESLEGKGFVDAFATARSAGTLPDIIVTDNYSAVDALLRVPGMTDQLQTVIGALAEAGDFAFQVRGSPQYAAASRLTLREPRCVDRPLGRALPPAEGREELESVAVEATRAYVASDDRWLERVADPKQLGPPSASIGRSAEVVRATFCSAFGNGHLAGVLVATSVSADTVRGHLSVLSIWRRAHEKWRLLAITRDPVSTGAFYRRFSRLSRSLAPSLPGVVPAEPAAPTDLAPPDGELARPPEGKRFGELVWGHSTSKAVIAEVVEVEFDIGNRLFVFGVDAAIQDRRTPGNCAVGALWGGGRRRWRVWAISRDGGVGFSAPRSFEY